MTTKQHITIAALLLCIIGVGHAQSVAGEGKEVISKPATAPALGDAWQFAITPYFWLPSVDLNLFLPTVNISNRSFGGDISTASPGGRASAKSRKESLWPSMRVGAWNSERPLGRVPGWLLDVFARDRK